MPYHACGNLLGCRRFLEFNQTPMQTSIQPDVSKPPHISTTGDEGPPIAMQKASVPMLLLKEMRPIQWSKNVLLFAGLLFALPQLMGSSGTLLTAVFKAVAGFALFCLFSSSIYLINDLRDRERDRLNPRTAKRPIASGALKPATAAV